MYSTTIVLELTVEARLRAEDAETAARQADEIVQALENGTKLEHIEGVQAFRYRATDRKPEIAG